MLYYSEKTKQFYKTEKELTAGEKKHEAEVSKIEKEKEIRKERAKLIEAAQQNIFAVREEMSKKVKEVEKQYQDLLEAFINDYGSYHYSVNNVEHLIDGHWSDVLETILNTHLF